MKIINHLKNGTIVEDMSTVTVPPKTAEAVMKILGRRSNEASNKKNSK